MTPEERRDRLNIIRHVHRKLYIQKLTKGTTEPEKTRPVGRVPNTCFLCGRPCNCNSSHHIMCILSGSYENMHVRSLRAAIAHWDMIIPKGSVSKDIFNTSAKDIHALLNIGCPPSIKFIKPIVDSW